VETCAISCGGSIGVGLIVRLLLGKEQQRCLDAWDRVRVVVEREFREDRPELVLDRPPGDTQFLCDRLVVLATGELPEGGPLAGCEETKR
jgi:hypothetical protein